MSLNCIVIVREVWDTRDLSIRVVDDVGKLSTDRLATRFDPEDLNALEMALKLKDAHGGKVTALSFGQARGVDVLKECLYRGADDTVRVTGPDGATLDTHGQAVLLAAAIGKLGAYDLVLSGVSVSEGESSLLGAHVAALLGIEAISWMDALEEAPAGKVIGRRAIEMGYEFIEATLPAALLVGVALLKEDPRTPRSAKAALKLKHKKTDAASWTTETLGAAAGATGPFTAIVSYSAIAERVIESRTVDANDDAALAAMLTQLGKAE